MALQWRPYPPHFYPLTKSSVSQRLLRDVNQQVRAVKTSDVIEWRAMRWRLSTSPWCWPSYSTLPPPPGGVLQTRLTKTGLNHLYDVE